PATEPLLNPVCDPIAWHDSGYRFVERRRDIPGEGHRTEGRAADPGDGSGLDGLVRRFDPVYEVRNVLEGCNVRRPAGVHDQDGAFRIGQRAEIELTEGLGHLGDAQRARLTRFHNNRAM